MTLTEKILKEFFESKNIEYTKEQIEKFELLCSELIKFNEHTNLTAIKDEEGIAVKHFSDSLYPLAYGLIPDGSKVIDVGCGAGFPGLPLLLMKNIDMSFLDSTEKKLRFTSLACEKIGKEAHFYPRRAEELSKAELREGFDIVVSRAVASLPVLLELCIPFLKVGGIFIAYKAEKGLCGDDGELAASKNAQNALCVALEKEYSANLSLEDEQKHVLLVFRKNKKTPTQYPRKYAQILKKPL